MPVFAFRPNWSESFVDRLEWLTDVLASRDGTEQRVQVRNIPRRSFSFSILAHKAEFQLLDAILASSQSSTVTVPFWPDKTTLSSALAQGGDTFSVNTVGRDYHIGGRLVVGTSALNCEELIITAMTDTSIQTTEDRTRDWPIGAFIAPARVCHVESPMTVTRPTAKVSTAPMRFTVVDTNAIAGAWDGVYTYLDTEVCVRRPNRAEDVTVQYQRLQEVLDFETGPREIDDFGDRPFNVRSYTYLLKSRAAIYDFREWLFERCGQLNPFWSPTWERNFEIVGSTSGASAVVPITNSGMTMLFDDLPGRMDIALRDTSGAWAFRGITGFSAHGSDDSLELVTLDATVPNAAKASHWSMCSFLELCVLNADAVEIAYRTDSVAETTVAIRSVNQ